MNVRMVHQPVLLKEVIELLDIHEGDIYLDATVGEGGHALEIKKRCGSKVEIVGIDADPRAIERIREKFKEGKFEVLNFREIDRAPKTLGIESPNKILFDLGWSKEQFALGSRGFSFQIDEPLDMRYGKESKFNAYDIVNKWQEQNIRTIIESYGEERFAGKIAKAIVKSRKEKPIKTSFELVEVIMKATPVWYHHKKIHPATKTFQALRIAVNDELEALQEGLEKAFEILKKGGRLAVISFQSLEDRIVKNFFRSLKNQTRAEVLIKKPIIAGRQEIKENLRSRSAKLRVIKKL